MKGRSRVFKVGALHHIYQRTINGYLIFYSVRDFLVFFTLFCTVARKYDIKVLGICLMYDHIHVLVVAGSKAAMSAFVCEYTCRFSRQRNRRYNREGDFFRHRYGSAPKVDEKKARTAIAYLYNNPVEKKLCRFAEEFQWDFLAYAKSDHPFSHPLRLNCASKPLRRAIAEVRQLRDADSPLRYEFIDRIIKNLSSEEILQLTDYIVVQYNCIDYSDLSSYYEDFQSLLTAVHSNTGSEYQIKEIVLPGSDAIYKRMMTTIRKMTGCRDMREVLSLSDSEKQRLAWILAAETGATPRQISKMLQMPLNKAGKL
ncbi:MAG: transposase [Bacteroidales bacterium]|nr:transposase [Bacteroidales bacterium]